VQRLSTSDPTLAVGVIARTSFRKHWVEELAAERNLEFECWDRAVDSAEVRTILHRCAQRLPTVGDGANDLEALESQCLAACPADDVDLRDGLLDGIDLLRDLTAMGASLPSAIGTLAVRSDDVVSAGLHFLNAHVGKGQQFDWVFVLGLEDGSIPSYLAKSADEKAEELRVLHVMCSRARIGLVFTTARDVRWNPAREWLRDESPWLGRIEQFATGEGDLTADSSSVGSHDQSVK
jgi:DNA helicase-2/ATP-dependent DNA helicase PcrA